MIIVHIWEGTYGHAALEIPSKSHPSTGYVYISFHPKAPDQDFGKFSEWAGYGDFLVGGVEAAYAKDYPDDEARIKNFARRIQAQRGLPYDETEYDKHHFSVNLFNLNEEAIIQHWLQLVKEEAKYQVLFRNCSTVVAQCLVVGKLSISNKLEDRKLTNWQLMVEMVKLRNEFVWRTRRPKRSTPKNRYTYPARESASYPGRWRQLAVVSYATFAVSALISLGFGVLTAPIGAIGITAGLVFSFLDVFHGFIWDPHVVHNLVLYLKGEGY